MMPTETLRAMLDERGVKHTDAEDGHTQHTWWSDGDHEIAACNSGERLAVYNLTPEQAVDATLGSSNCTNDCTNDCTNSERTETCEMEYVTDWMSWHCKSCDHMDMAPRNPKPRYCKWCGRKVVLSG